MNKKFIPALVLACAAACFFAACSKGNGNSSAENGNTTQPPFADQPITESESQIKSAFAKKYNLNTGDVSLVKCDVQDGVYAVYACGDDTALSYETVGPITFIFPNTPHRMEICYLGRFYSVTTACDRGFLSNDAWLNIAKKRGKDWYRLDEDKWAEIKSAENEIKSAFAQKYDVDVDTVFLSSYGEYNGAHAVMITAEGFGYATAITYDTVGGIILTYPDSCKMVVYYNGKFCSLPAAYEKGLLTNADLIEIAKKYGGYYLTEQEEAEIIAAYRESSADEIANGAEVVITSFYGEVGGYYALAVGVEGTAPYLDKIVEITVDGELFGKEYHTVEKIEYINDFGISLYKDGSLYTLKYAVENNLISVDDFIELSQHNSFYFRG
ncbi:MAG: hypothetical protein K2N50_04540 [Clostridia bacterium]|nr:hypothetical protein [Clostridia bacterium]